MIKRLLPSMVLTVAIVCSCTGCMTNGLMATPNLYQDTNRENPFASLPAEQQVNRAQVIYGTDRQVKCESPLQYGYRRSRSFTVGVTDVTFGHNVDWDTLSTESMQKVRTTRLKPHIIANRSSATVTPWSRFVEEYNRQNGDENLAAARKTLYEELHRLVTEQLQKTDDKEAYVYIHGFNVNFEQSISTIAQLWHFLGRTGVPIAYSWPAGHGGLRGYLVDRESSEFTVFHLKTFIEALAACPELERIHLIAHSRGTDVLLSALRELHIARTNAGMDTQRALKLGNIILAAPDLDMDVVSQRVAAEGLPLVPERMTVYISTTDHAISIAGWIFHSITRIGRLPFKLLTEREKQSIEKVPSLEIIDAQVDRYDLFGHSYFYRHPAVSSDLIYILVDDKDPGKLPEGRPLKPIEPGFWVIHDNYPAH